ncbi:hypothetical protein ACWEQU_12150 [Streptomyces nodosus]
MPVPADDLGALVLAVRSVRADTDGLTAWRQYLDVAGTVWLLFDGGLQPRSSGMPLRGAYGPPAEQ